MPTKSALIRGVELMSFPPLDFFKQTKSENLYQPPPKWKNSYKERKKKERKKGRVKKDRKKNIETIILTIINKWKKNSTCLG